MTVHVLHAGDGYTYLTRQVAAGDHTLKRGEDLSAYYTAEGNPQGVWLGDGLTTLGVGGVVAEEQMKALFGEGLHPDAEAAIAAAIAEGKSPEQAVAASRLGRRFMSTTVKEDGWNADVEAAYRQFQKEHDRVPEVGVERDLIRWNIARDRLATQLGRDATDSETSTYLAARGKAPRQPVAGYDLVFTPVKSVSVLWALGDKETAGQVSAAHDAAWRSTMKWLEKEAALTRVGAGGVGQVNTHGLIAAAFEHRDSRTGDPNLHTHVAVSTKVQGVDGKWRSLDGRVLHALGVSASERYNTLIEQELRQRLGVTFADEARGRNKRPVREIVGVSQELRTSFSSRRTAIEDAYAELVAEYVASHGHTPPSSVQLALAQRATLDTRKGKAPPKSLDLQRAEWRASAIAVLGEHAIDNLVATVQQPRQLSADDRKLAELDVDGLASRVLHTVEGQRSTWRRSHVEAEALRLVRAYAGVKPGVDVDELTASVTAAAVTRSIAIAAPELNPVPTQMTRADGASIYTVHGTQPFTSTRILRAEDALVAAAQTKAGFTISDEQLEAAVAKYNRRSKHDLDPSQVELARRFATGGHRIEIGIGPAGTGKTTAMRVFARAIEAGGGRVLALAPTAVASTVLAEEIDVEAETAHKLLQVYRSGGQLMDSDAFRIDSNTVLLIDEAGMADTPLLADVLALAEERGASIRLLGDPSQLAAVQAGGALRLIERNVGATYLDQVHRFKSTIEADATLLLRVGDTRSLDFYVDRDRTRGGTREVMLEEIYAAWSLDTAAGLKAIMVAGTNDEVSALSARARMDGIASGRIQAAGVLLHDGNKAGVGDRIVTRQNNRMLRTNRGKDFVANGDLWVVKARGADGSLKVKSIRHRGTLILPADYVATHVELGYAATINRVQGMTVQTSHILVNPEATTREQLYVAATRGELSNRLYAVVEEIHEVEAHAPDHARNSIVAALESVLRRESAEKSATETIEHELNHAASLARLVPEYEDARIRILDGDLLERMEATVRAALPEADAAAVLADDSWKTLATRLAQHEAAGVDVTDALRLANEERELDDYAPATSPARVLHHRLGPVTTDNETRRNLPAWITDSPVLEVGAEDPVREWVTRQGDLIADRIDQLVDDVEASKPTWSTALEQPPADRLEYERWRATMARVVAYRDLHQLVDDELALGSADTDAVARGDAEAALRDLRDRHIPDEPATTDDAPATKLQQLAALRGGAPGAAPTTTSRLEELQRRRDQAQQPRPATPDENESPTHGGPTL